MRLFIVSNNLHSYMQTDILVLKKFEFSGIIFIAQTSQG